MYRLPPAAMGAAQMCRWHQRIVETARTVSYRDGAWGRRRKLGEEKTVLLSTHVLQEVEAIASRVLFINEGRLVFDGPVDQFVADAKNMDERFHQLTAAAAS